MKHFAKNTKYFKKYLIKNQFKKIFTLVYNIEKN
jgi:hypothetical protein